MIDFAFCLWTHLGQNVLVIRLDPKATVSSCLEEISSKLNSFYRQDYPPSQLELFKLTKKVKTSEYKHYPTLLGRHIDQIARLVDPTEKISVLLDHNFSVGHKDRVLHALVSIYQNGQPEYANTTSVRSLSPELGDINGVEPPSRRLARQAKRRGSTTGSRRSLRQTGGRPVSYSSEDELVNGEMDHQSSSSESLDGDNARARSPIIITQRRDNIDVLSELPVGAHIQLRVGQLVRVVEIRRSPCTLCRDTDVLCQTICNVRKKSPRDGCLRCSVTSRVCRGSKSNTFEVVLDDKDSEPEDEIPCGGVFRALRNRHSIVNASDFDISVGNPVGAVVRIAHGQILRVVKKRKVSCSTCKDRSPCYDIQFEGETDLDTACYTCARQKKSCPCPRSPSSSRHMRSSQIPSPRENSSGERGQAGLAVTRGRNTQSTIPEAYHRRGRSLVARQGLNESHNTPYRSASGSKKRARSASLGESVGSKTSDSLDSTPGPAENVIAHGQHRHVERGARHHVPCLQCEEASVGGCYAVQSSKRKACFRCTRQRSACSLVQTHKRQRASRIEFLGK